MAISPDSSLAAYGINGNRIAIWPLDAKATLSPTLEGHTNDVRSIASFPDGERLVSAGFDHTVRIWNLRTGKCAKILRGHTQPVAAVAISVDGKWLVSGGGDSTVRVWPTDL